jgi:hypothetical protein
MKRPLFCFTAGLALLCASASPLVGAPRIAEFQADNEDTITDEDGDTSDWVEIYNPDATAVDLAGMGLSDDPLLPLKWVFPAVTLPANSSLLVWCSGKNRTATAQPLHTNFDLAAAGEYLAFTAADGTTKLSEWNPYPAQPADRSYGSARPVVAETMIGPNAACRWLVPSATITGWQNRTFVDTAWSAASTGIGYDNAATPVNYVPLIGSGGNTGTAMFNIRSTCYVRVPFTVTQPAEVQTLTLLMKYEDGFAAFLNGTRLNPPTAAQTNAPTTLAFNSAATAGRNDTDAVAFQSFDLTAQKSLLVAGTNVLAIQVLNATTSSSDVLCVPELHLTKVDGAAPLLNGYFAQPSPGTNNSATPVDGFVDAPDFSIKRGVFNAPVSVTLTTNTPGATIRYTTNGSPPTASSGTLYTEPVAISTTTILRASAFFPNWQPSTVKSHTYVFPAQVVNQPAAPPGFPSTWGNEYNFTTGTLTGPLVPADYRMDPGVTQDPAYAPLMEQALGSTLPIVSLATNTEAVFSLNGIYANGRLLDGTELPASIEYFPPGGGETFQEDAGLRMHGGDAPLEHPKKPFRVYFRKDYGNGRLRFPLFPESPVESFDVLQLRPGGHDGWSVPFGSGPESLARHATYMRDRFLRQCELDMGRTAVRGRYVHMYLNGLYWGVYDLHEVPNKEYFADHLGGADADWDVVEHSNTSVPLFDIVDGTGAAMDAALALCTPPSNLESNAVYAQVQQYIDVDEFIDHLIVQMWGAQNDWMGPVYRGTGSTNASRFFNKNWEAGRRSRGEDPTGFFWNVWDAEISMGNSLTNLVATMRVDDFDHTRIGTPASISGITGTPGPPAQLYYALRQNPAFRMRFADRLQRHFFNGGVMSASRNLHRLTSLETQLNLPLVAESARWGDVNTGDPDVVTFTRDEHWQSEVNWLKNTYIAGRGDTLLGQFSSIGIWPDVAAPTTPQFGGIVPAGYNLTLDSPSGSGGTIYYTLDGSDPMMQPESQVLTLAGPNTATTVYYTVPASTPAGNSWKNIAPPADIATWSTGTAGLGFDANPTFTPLITTQVAGMQGVNSSLYVRVPFQVTAQQLSSLTSLTLRLQYDDGAFVFLNGSTPLYRLNAPVISPVFNAVATAARPDTTAVVPQVLDLTPYISSLTSSGDNLLAIQGLNISAADDDFLCIPELTATFLPPPAPSASAIAYTDPVTLTQSVLLKARVLKDGVWSPLLETSFIAGVPAAAGNLVVSEFSYNPVASTDERNAGSTDQQFEFIELLNISTAAVELAGCRFSDGILFDFADSSVQRLLPGQRLVLAASRAALTLRHPGLEIAGEFASETNLSNGGERLTLLSAGGQPVFDFPYSDDPPWPAAADGAGFSLVLINPVTNPDMSAGQNWRAGIAVNGKPGLADGDTYSDWALRLGIAGDAFDDTNRNGLSNLTEYALGITTPEVQTSGFESAGFETLNPGTGPDTYVVLRYRRSIAADDVTVTPEMSLDLDSWTPLTDPLPPATINPDGTESLAFRSPLPVSAGTRIYLRLSIRFR